MNLPPGPKLGMLGQLRRSRSGPLPFLVQTAQRYGDIAYFRRGRRRRFCLLSNPEHIHAVLVADSANFTKSPALREAEVTLGRGLLTSEGELHRRQRRLIQPALHPRQVGTYAQDMVRIACAMAEQWRDGHVVDMSREMTELTLRIVARTLFGAEIESEVRELGDSMAILVTMFDRTNSPWGPLLNRLRFLPSNRRFGRAQERIWRSIARMIEQRRSGGGEQRNDLLSILLRARDDDGRGAGMSDQQLRDEAITLFMAGHETTANALVWTWYLLSENEPVRRRLSEHLGGVLGGRAPEPADLPALSYVRAVVAESMRLFPPAWIVARQCVDAYRVDNYTLPAGTIVLMSQYIVQRDPRWWPEPQRFDPQRWLEDDQAKRPRYAYFPFGGGERQCIGEPFAWMEAMLVLATLAQRWRAQLLPEEKVLLHPTITLRPRHGMRMRLERAD